MKYEKRSKVKSEEKAKPRKKRNPVTKPVVATKPALPEAVEKSAEPAAVTYDGFDVIGKWSGLDQCKCRFCGELIIHIEKAQKHVYSEHMKPVLLQSVEVESKLLDAQGKHIKKTVLEPLTEEKDNG